MVARSVDHRWSVPEFQRGFVWKPAQVRELIESLWLGYPVGSLLIWESAARVQTRSASDGQQPGEWLVDGQQRTTALCILSGRKPYWWKASKDWETVLKRYDVRFDVHTKEPPYFVIANAATSKVRGLRYVRVAELLSLDTEKEDDQRRLQSLAKQIKLDGFCDGMDAMEVYTRLDRVRKIRNAEIVVITVDNDLEDVVEIFARLNSKGTRVKEADIYLGVVAARSPGWVREHFLPFVDELEAAGFVVSPNLMFRTLTAVGSSRIIYKSVPDEFWEPASIEPAWAKTKKAWAATIKHLQPRGISGNAILPADNVLVTTIALVDKFPEQSFDRVYYWLLQASRFGRYSGSTTTALDEDLKAIERSSTLVAALEELLRNLRYLPPLAPADFLKDYSDGRFGRLLIYLLAWKNQAIDWDARGFRIGFDNTEVLAGFEPQFHHVFPRKFLAGKAAREGIEALANIAVIGPAINIRISNQNPMGYIPKYGITDDKLRQQYIDPDLLTTPPELYDAWLARRAGALAEAGNAYLESMRGGLALPGDSAATAEHAYDAA